MSRLPFQPLAHALHLSLALLAAACGDPAATPPLDASDAGATGPDATPDAAEPDARLPDAAEPFDHVAPRIPGQRAPLTAPCDDADPLRCLLPWPSDVFTIAAPQTPTGLRVALDPARVPPHDDASSLQRADGHSRLSPIVTAFGVMINPASIEGDPGPAMRVLISEPGQGLGQDVPLRFNLTLDPERGESILVAYPRRPMAPATEHVALVLDDLKDDAGAPPPRDRHAAIALGLEPPASAEEAALAAWHHPSRLAMEAAGIDARRVVRVWSFTTRSARDPHADLVALRATMREAVDTGQAIVIIDDVQIAPRPGIAAIVRGRLAGLPDFVDRTGGLTRDAQGRLEPIGDREAPFRVVLPEGQGDYRIVMYGHGTGGDVSDSSFDQIIAQEGAAKVGIEFEAWTERGLLASAGDFLSGLKGSDRTAARLIESIAMGMAIQRALAGPLGDALAAPLLAGQPNPAEGRRPDPSGAVWTGGSLGGVTGAVYASAEPEIGAAVLNVPGAGFTHFLRFSELYGVLRLLLESSYDSKADIEVAIAMAQLNLDRVDGGAWVDAVDDPPVLLIQQSVGDPVLPDIGSELLAHAADAILIGEPLTPMPGLRRADRAEAASAATQFKTPEQGNLEIHGFAARDTPAGVAAREQIRGFIFSHWQGAALITLPQACLDNTPTGSCDFSP